MRIPLVCVIAFVAGIATRGTAQTSQPPPAPTFWGTVTGHVLCEDTRRPARLAEVALVRKPEEPAHPTTEEPPAPQSQSSAPTQLALQVAYQSTWSTLDGSYAIPHVQPGDYYVVAKLDGYIVPLVVTPGKKAVNEDEVDIPPLLTLDTPVIHVTGDQTDQVDLTLKRGGTISGRLLFDDGTPAARAWVWVEPASGAVAFSSQQILALANGWHQATTNDQGQYRIAGLEPGKYRVLTAIPLQRQSRLFSNSGYSNLTQGAHRSYYDPTIYSPGTFRPSEAKLIEIKGEEHDADTDIEIRAGSLHSIEGRLVAKSDSHALKYAMVLVYMKDEFAREEVIAQNGVFHVDYLPKGTYTVQIQAQEEPLSAAPSGAQKNQGYQQAKLTVVVDDHDVVMGDVIMAEFKPTNDSQ
jgi:hypothetical protein